MDRFSEYRIMWVLVFFDLPTDTKKERKAAAKFRKELIEDGFIMFQFSIYMRHCPSAENAATHIKRVKGFLPQYGQVGILSITDKQFSSMELFSEHKEKEKPELYVQLELF
jgi:CRISPR-associated protein Cas2